MIRCTQVELSDNRTNAREGPKDVQGSSEVREGRSKTKPCRLLIHDVRLDETYLTFLYIVPLARMDLA